MKGRPDKPTPSVRGRAAGRSKASSAAALAVGALLAGCGHRPGGTGDIGVGFNPPAVRAAMSSADVVPMSGGLLLRQPGRYDFGWRLHRFDTMAVPVVEYTEPALQIAEDGVVVERFAFEGSMEGPHISPVHPFSGLGRRRDHRPIRGVMRGLWSEDIGEDALTVGPWATLELEHAMLRGRHLPGRPWDGDLPGEDKGIQNDGGTLLAGPGVTLANFVRAYRGKANSVGVLDGVRFVECHNPVRGDGEANPREDWPFDRGEPGLCLIVVRNTVFIDCHNPFRAGPGCVILVDLASVRFENIDGPMVIEEGGGRVIFTRQLEREWRRLARAMDDPGMAGLERAGPRRAGADERTRMRRR